MNSSTRPHAFPCVLALLCLFVTGCVHTPPRAVVMISLDGLAGFYMDDPKADMPTLRKLRADGASSNSMLASTPTVTWTNHTTLMTGVNPARHGVVGNNYFDRATDKPVVLISDPVYDKAQIVKAPTIYDLAKAAGLKTAAVRWPASRNAETLDWAVPDVASKDLLRKYSTPELVRECERAGIWSDGELTEPGKSDKRIITDEMCTAVFKLILRKHRPDLALLHLINIDHIEHLNGPRSSEAYAAIKAADEQVRQVMDEVRHDYGDRATVVIVSDHGFSAIEHSIFPNVVLRNAKLVDVKGTRVVGGPVRLVVQGGSAFVYVLDREHRADVIAKVKGAFRDVAGVERVVSSEEFASLGVADPAADPHAPDVILFAKDGYVFGDTAAGALSFREKPERKGSHGHSAALPNLHAMFVAAGRDVRSGVTLGEIRNLDVAPTVAKLLGLTIPDADGAPLVGALLDGNSAPPVASR